MQDLIKYSILVLALLLGAAGCKKDLDKYSKNPDNPSSITPNVWLTSNEISLASVVGGDLSRFESIFDQQVTSGAGARNFNVYTAYTFSTSDFNASWINLYATMYNCKGLRDSSIAHSYNVYAGIADILLAATAGYTTDVYGDIPYSQALQAPAILQPAVDPQQSVYAAMQSLLDSGIARLSAGSAGNLVPGSDDLIYGGNTSSWIQLAYSLKARYYLHLRKVDNTAIAKAIAASANGLSRSASDAYVGFGGSAVSASPWAQFTQNWEGELSFINGADPVMSTLMSVMYAQNDPRITSYIDTTSGDPTYDQPVAFWGNYVANNGHVAIMTYAEQLFINAELDSVMGNQAQAATDFNNAVTASVDAFAASNNATTSYLNTYANETASSITLRKIMTQKWIALFLNPEAFTDWRRTGYPILSPDPNATTSIPRRFYYPQQEIAGNSHVAAIEPNITLQGRVWWDVP